MAFAFVGASGREDVRPLARPGHVFDNFMERATIWLGS